VLQRIEVLHEVAFLQAGEMQAQLQVIVIYHVHDESSAARSARVRELSTLGTARTKPIDDVPLIGQRQIFFSDPAGDDIELDFQMNAAAILLNGRFTASRF
jgi:hypothetical protein